MTLPALFVYIEVKDYVPDTYAGNAVKKKDILYSTSVVFISKMTGFFVLFLSVPHEK